MNKKLLSLICISLFLGIFSAGCLGDIFEEEPSEPNVLIGFSDSWDLYGLFPDSQGNYVSTSDTVQVAGITNTFLREEYSGISLSVSIEGYETFNPIYDGRFSFYFSTTYDLEVVELNDPNGIHYEIMDYSYYIVMRILEVKANTINGTCALKIYNNDTVNIDFSIEKDTNLIINIDNGVMDINGNEIADFSSYVSGVGLFRIGFTHGCWTRSKWTFLGGDVI